MPVDTWQHDNNILFAKCQTLKTMFLLFYYHIFFFFAEQPELLIDLGNSEFFVLSINEGNIFYGTSRSA